MTKVTIYTNELKEYVGFKAVGHAGYAREGEDIVCASISVLIINTINAIEAFTTTNASLMTDDAQGLIDYKILDRPTEDTTLLLKAMVLGLEHIAENKSYEEYIDLTIEEV